MCGICGIHSTTPDEPALSRMMEALRHRGPDDGGAYRNGGFSLGHRRLSIIDVSANGRQPMANEDNSLWLVANGEIYNFQELRDLLTVRGHVFRSKTDTETILHLYEDYGVEALSHLRGMFAFGLLDQKAQRLFLARDRMGIKPLYYASVGGRFLFASEIKGILASGLVRPEIDLAALDLYLAWGYVPPPRTLIKGIQALLPGHYLLYEGGRISIKKYWDFPLAGKGKIVEADLLEEVRSLLEESTRLHRVSDVPLGAFLSGGVDSTAVVALMSKISSMPVKTFSIGFRDGPARLNELKYARIVAKRYQTDHTEVLLGGEDVAKSLGHMVRAIDQPSFDGLNTYLVSRAARQGGLTVALSGLGGDELFGGYNIFNFLPRLSPWLGLWRRIPTPLRKGFSRSIAFSMSNRARAAKLRRFAAASTPLDLYTAIRFNFSDDERENLYVPDVRQKIVSEAGYLPPQEILRKAVPTNGNAWQMTSRLELQSFMMWRLLRDTDAMSMAHSLEVRVPFVDHKVVETVCRLPEGWNRRWGFPKKLLVEALVGSLPPEILNRPKQGFQFPMAEWMRGALRPVVEDTFSESSIRKRGLFNPQAVQEIYRSFLAGILPYETAWMFVVLELWMRETLDV